MKKREGFQHVVSSRIDQERKEFLGQVFTIGKLAETEHLRDLDKDHTLGKLSRYAIYRQATKDTLK